MTEKKITIQRIWGIVLLFTGGGMFFTIPDKVRTIQEAGEYSHSTIIFLQICFYIISLILVLGGGKKIYTYFLSKQDTDTEI